MNPFLQRPAITAADVPDSWVAAFRDAKSRLEGAAVQGGAIVISKAGEKPVRMLFTIDVQTINTGAFGPVMLPGNGYTFTTAEERDAVLGRIHHATH